MGLRRDGHLGPVDLPVQITYEAFPAHEMDNRSWSVIGALALSEVGRQKIFKDLSKHFRVNGHLLFKGFVFTDSKVVGVKNLEDFLKEIVVYQDVGFLPVVAVDGVEEPAIQERDSHIKAVVIVILPFYGKGCIEKRLKDITKEVVVIYVFLLVEPLEKIFWTVSPGFELAVLVPANPKPSLFL